ncbi:MAG: hypothetical protein CMO40_05625 [Verrucomicrobiaceae bacterium]|nr:hypothetical protein [Verrucomicrobiaceae bacterium]
MANGQDYFSVLGLERRVDLDLGNLQQSYDRRCREVHPDNGGAREDFEVVREAFFTLQSPARRLRHWLETSGIEGTNRGSVPALVADRFEEINSLLQDSETVAQRHRNAQSALVRSMAEAEGLTLQGRLADVREEVAEAAGKLVSRFGNFDRLGPARVAEEAGETVRALTFLEKWEEQLRTAWARAGCW